MRRNKITYSQAGVNYAQLDSIKKLAQQDAKKTSKNLLMHGFSEVSESRGESAYVWKQGNYLMALVVEGLGTKSIVADSLYKETGKVYYDVIAQDTVATIINDLTSVGATPLVLNAYWASASNQWFSDKKRMSNFILGWKKACDLAGASWGGGETPTLKGIIEEGVADLGGSAVGIIHSKKNLITDKGLKEEDRIILVKSNGINANGLTLARMIAKKLPKGYGTKIGEKTYGESLLTKSNIYAKLVQSLQKANIDIHYISNITGHGMRKVMRGRPNFTYVVEKVFEPQEVFKFIQKQANLNDYEMYQTYNMGQDYAIFVSPGDVNKCLSVIKRSGFKAIDAGFVKKGKRRVEIAPKKIIFEGESLNLR